MWPTRPWKAQQPSAASITIEVMINRGLLGALLSFLLFTACQSAQSAPAREGASAEVHSLTGAHTRVVWVQGDGTDPFAMGRYLVLMGLDTDDGKGELVIVKERGSIVKPMLTPRGNRILASTHFDHGESSIYIVNFD